MTNFLDSRRAILAFAALYVLVLLVNVVAAVGGGVSPDQARDSYFAARIAAGLEFPLGGPVIYDTFQLGPLWLYVCAVPLALGGGFASVAILTAALSTLKYPLAFWLGCRAVDARFGWLLALSVLCTGWTWVPLKFLTHAALVESAVWLLFAVVLVWWRSRSVLASLAVGLAAALAVHAHPSTLLIAGCCCALVTILGVWNRRWHAVLAMFAGGLLLFVPYFIEQAWLGWQVFSSVTRYVGTDVHWPTLSSTLRLVAAALVNGHSYELQYLVGLPALLVKIVVWAIAGLLVAVAALAIGNAKRLEPKKRTMARFALLCLAALVAQAMFLVSIRPITPLWMMFSMLPLSAALLACTLSIVPNAGWGRALRTGVAALLAVSATVSATGYLKDSYAEMFLPDDASAGMLDVKQRPVGGHLYNLAFFRVGDVDEVVGISMRYRVVHGLAAVVVDESFGGVRTNMDAGARNALPVLGGMVGADNQTGAGQQQKNIHIAGFTPEAWRTIGRVPAFSGGRLGWVQPVQIINPGVGHAVAHPGSPRHFMARQPFMSRAKFVLDFAAACGQVVAVTNIMRSYAAAPTVNATANGAAIAPRFQDTATYFFDVPACISGEIAGWRLTIDGVREAVDVVTF